MKTVFLVRHAKSSWTDTSLRDIDRPLNKRGKRDAPFMANLLKGQEIKPDAIISSPANRAYTTACYFAKALGIEKKAIIQEPEIYEAYGNEVLNIIQALPNKYQVILVFGHNPNFTDLANLFTEDYIDNVPTCGIVQIEAAINDWQKFDKTIGKIINFHYPKQYL